MLILDRYGEIKVLASTVQRGHPSGESFLLSSKEFQPPSISIYLEYFQARRNPKKPRGASGQTVSTSQTTDATNWQAMGYYRRSNVLYDFCMLNRIAVMHYKFKHTVTLVHTASSGVTEERYPAHFPE
jgi:hypothetical protein